MLEWSILRIHNNCLALHLALLIMLCIIMLWSIPIRPKHLMEDIHVSPHPQQEIGHVVHVAVPCCIYTLIIMFSCIDKRPRYSTKYSFSFLSCFFSKLFVVRQMGTQVLLSNLLWGTGICQWLGLNTLKSWKYKVSSYHLQFQYTVTIICI